jgi:hypothetical protein
MTQRPVHLPGQTAPASATYEQMNVFGSPTGIRVNVMQGHPLPEAPIGRSGPKAAPIKNYGSSSISVAAAVSAAGDMPASRA